MPQPSIRRARRLRATSSATEQRLWKLLRDRRLAGLKFRRQVPLGAYIADFLCLHPRLVIEADGPFHDAERDAVRDAWLEVQGFRVLRFTNSEVQNATEQVLDRILVAAGRL